MAFTPLSDLGRHFANQQANVQMRERLAILTAEVASGEAHDLPAQLGTRANQFAAHDYRLGMIASYSKAGSLMATQLAAAQSALENIDLQRSTISTQLIAISPQATQVELSAGAEAARNGFAQLISALNTQIGGVTLFAGTASDAPATASADVMLNAIETYIGGAVTVSDVQNGIAEWFADIFPTDPTEGYQGNTQNMGRQIDKDLSVALDVRADDPVVMQLLQDLATAAIADRLGFSGVAQAQLLNKAGEGLITQASGLTEVRARVGLAEQTLAQSQTRLAAEKTSLGTARNDLAQVDTFEAATALQAVSDQLELHYTLTARLAALTLTNYLR